ncbi:MFS transporter [Variovorax sp. AFSI2.2]|uniref:MFS transporter n=1 Tax=Variovorax sp. AFSI2.2 TaxID=3384160 RepID=UPI003EB8B79B
MQPDRHETLGAPQVGAALAIGTVALLMVGVQPIALGELVEARKVSLEGVGVVAMGEIVALGVGSLIGDAMLPVARLRLVTIVAALLTVVINLLSALADGDVQMLAARVAAGVPEGVLVWCTTAVLVRTAQPARVAGIFVVVMALGQAAFGMLLAHLIIPGQGWRGVFTALALASLLPLALAFMQRPRLAPLVPPAVSGFRWSPHTLRPLAVVFLQLAALGAFAAYLEPLGKAAGLDSRSAQTLVAGMLGMQVVGGIAGTAAVRRWPTVASLVGASLGLAAVTAMTFRLPTGGAQHLMLATAAFGFVWLFMQPFQFALTFLTDGSGRLGTLIPAAQLLGSAFGPLMASFVVVGDDASAVPLVSAGFAVAAALLVLGAARRRAMGTA